VVGADGGTSGVRRSTGIGWSVLGSEGHHLSVLFRGDLSAAVGQLSYALYLAADGLPIAAVALGADVVDPGGDAASCYRVADTSAVLVRPDGHVAARLRGTASQAGELLREAVDRALGGGRHTDAEAIAG